MSGFCKCNFYILTLDLPFAVCISRSTMGWRLLCTLQRTSHWCGFSLSTCHVDILTLHLFVWYFVSWVCTVAMCILHNVALSSTFCSSNLGYILLHLFMKFGTRTLRFAFIVLQVCLLFLFTCAWSTWLFPSEFVIEHLQVVSFHCVCCTMHVGSLCADCVLPSWLTWLHCNIWSYIFLVCCMHWHF